MTIFVMDDHVISEIDVFLSKALAENLLLFQYPVRPNSMTYEDVKVLEARSKPKQQSVELEMEVNFDSSCYDKGKGEQFVINSNSNNKAEKTYFSGEMMDKQKLTSTKTIGSTARYAVGILRNGNLHLSPLNGMLQLRPTFSYLDLGDSETNPDRHNDNGADDLDGDLEEDAKTVSVKFAHRETDRAKMMRERSYGFLQKKMSEEAWIDLKYNPLDSEASHLLMKEIDCMQPDESAAELHVLDKDYFQMLLPENLDIDFGSPYLPPTDVMSMNYLRQLPLGDQIRTLLINAKVLKFQQLMTLLPSNVDIMAVIRAIQQFAVLVQGCWVVKSEVLYPKDSFSVHTGVPAEILCRARDYIMWRFTQSLTITRKEITSLVKLPHDDIRDILEQIARLRPLKGWAFIMSPDDFFVRRHTEVVQRQQMLWDAKYQKLSRTINLPNAGDGSDGNNAKSPTKIRQRRRTKSSHSGETSEEDVKLNVSVSDILKSPKQDQRFTTASNVVVKDEPMNFDCKNHQELQDNNFHVQLMDFLREKLRSNGCSSLSNLKLLLNAKLIDSLPGHVLSQGVSCKVMEAALQEIGAKHVNAHWPTENYQEPIYAFESVGDNQDPYRKILLDLFSSTTRYRKNIIKKKLEEATGDHLSDKDFLEFLKGFCVYSRTGFYVLKGTMTPNL